MTDHLCNSRHRILAVLQSLGAEADSEEVAEVFQALEAIVGDLDSRLHAERLANAAIAQERDEARKALADRDAAWGKAVSDVWSSWGFDRYGIVCAFIEQCRKVLGVAR